MRVTLSALSHQYLISSLIYMYTHTSHAFTHTTHGRRLPLVNGCACYPLRVGGRHVLLIGIVYPQYVGRSIAAKNRWTITCVFSSLRDLFS